MNSGFRKASRQSGPNIQVSTRDPDHTDGPVRPRRARILPLTAINRKTAEPVIYPLQCPAPVSRCVRYTPRSPFMKHVLVIVLSIGAVALPAFAEDTVPYRGRSYPLPKFVYRPRPRFTRDRLHSQRDAHVALTIYFADREPAGPYRITVPARRTLHLRFNDLAEPSPVPRDTDFSSVFASDSRPAFCRPRWFKRGRTCVGHNIGCAGHC